MYTNIDYFSHISYIFQFRNVSLFEETYISPQMIAVAFSFVVSHKSRKAIYMSDLVGSRECKLIHFLISIFQMWIFLKHKSLLISNILISNIFTSSAREIFMYFEIEMQSILLLQEILHLESLCNLLPCLSKIVHGWQTPKTLIAACMAWEFLWLT